MQVTNLVFKSIYSAGHSVGADVLDLNDTLISCHSVTLDNEVGASSFLVNQYKFYDQFDFRY